MGGRGNLSFIKMVLMFKRIFSYIVYVIQTWNKNYVLKIIVKSLFDPGVRFV